MLHIIYVDYYNDIDQDYFTKIAFSSEKILSFFSEEFTIPDQFGHNESFLYPYLAEIAEIMLKNSPEKANIMLKAMLEHNKYAYEELNRGIVSALGQYLDSMSLNPNYPLPEEMKAEYKKAILSDSHMDKSKHLVSFSYRHGKSDYPGEYSGAVKPPVRTSGNRKCDFTRVVFYLIRKLHALIYHVLRQCW